MGFLTTRKDDLLTTQLPIPICQAFCKAIGYGVGEAVFTIKNKIFFILKTLTHFAQYPLPAIFCRAKNFVTTLSQHPTSLTVLETVVTNRWQRVLGKVKSDYQKKNTIPPKSPQGHFPLGSFKGAVVVIFIPAFTIPCRSDGLGSTVASVYSGTLSTANRIF